MSFLTLNFHFLLCFRLLIPVSRSRLAAFFDARRIQDSADDVIPHADQVFDAAAAEHHHRVLLDVVPFARNVCRDFHAVRETHAGDLAESGVRLFRSRCRNFRADSALERRRIVDRAILKHIESARQSHRL